MAYSINERETHCPKCGAVIFREATEETYYDPHVGRITERTPIPAETIAHTAVDCQRRQQDNADGIVHRR